jgi:hypothetical protein
VVVAAATRSIPCEDSRWNVLSIDPRLSVPEPHHLTAAQLLPDDDILGRINTVNLEHVLGEIQTNRGDLRVEGPHVIRLTTITLRHFHAGERAPSTTPKADSCSAAK